LIALITTVFIASLLGSLHCAGMCGVFLTIAVGEGGVDRKRRAVLNGAYQFGRLVTYVMLGVAAGALGALVDMGGALAGISRAAVMLSGGMMVLFGVSAGLTALGKRTMRMPVPRVMRRLLEAGHRMAMHFPPVSRALVIGLLTTMLPCGWLYAFAAVAAGTASPLLGGLTMAVFWLGTLPVMVAMGVGVQQLTGALGRKLPHVTAVVLILVGLWTLAGRGMLDANAMARRLPVFEDTQAAREAVVSINEQPPSCCEQPK